MNSQNLPLESVFKNNHQAYVAYFTAGDGDLTYNLAVVSALVDAGVDILEIGLPFSDPIADGPVIQQAMQRALSTGMNSANYLFLLSAVRKAHPDLPIVVFTYYNPLLQAGENFYTELSDAGANAILVVDLPLEHATIHNHYCHNAKLATIQIATVETSLDRFKQIDALTSGFVYYVSQLGTTGMRSGLPTQLSEHLQQIKAQSHWPICCGFGIQSIEQAKTVLEHADGFVVGSYLVEQMGRRVDPEIIKDHMKQLDPRQV